MAKWYSAGISNPSRDEGMGSNPGAVQKKKKITGRHLGVMTWVWPGPLRVSEVQGRNTCYKGGFFSEDSLLSSSPMSFYLLVDIAIVDIAMVNIAMVNIAIVDIAIVDIAIVNIAIVNIACLYLALAIQTF